MEAPSPGKHVHWVSVVKSAAVKSQERKEKLEGGEVWKHTQSHTYTHTHTQMNACTYTHTRTHHIHTNTHMYIETYKYHIHNAYVLRNSIHKDTQYTCVLK